MKKHITLLIFGFAALLASCGGNVKPESTNVKGDNSIDARVVTLDGSGVSVEVSSDKGAKSVVIVPVEFVLEKTISEVEMAEATMKLTSPGKVKVLTLTKEEQESLGFFISANARGDKKVVNFTAEMKTNDAHVLAESATSYRIEGFKLIRKGDSAKAEENKSEESEKPAAPTAPAAPAAPSNPGKNELKEMADQASPASHGQTWTGSIKGAGGITMYINSVTGEFWYYYNKFGPNAKLYLSVLSNNGNFLELYEQNDYGEVTGTFSGRLTGNTYSGTFTNYKGRTFSFSLHR